MLQSEDREDTSAHQGFPLPLEEELRRLAAAPSAQAATSGEVAPDNRAVDYREMLGALDLGQRPDPAGDLVVLSSLARASGWSPPEPALCVRYVARGRIDYRIGGRAFRLSEGQMMVSPGELGTEIEIGRLDRSGTFGLCILLRGCEDELSWFDGPLIASAEAEGLGRHIEKAASRLASTSHRKIQLAAQLVSHVRGEVPKFSRQLHSRAAAVQAVKASTRHEMVRRASLAQAYLHGSPCRAVALEELSREVGVSRFHLLRAFQYCFGETPAAYHRKLRVRRVLAEARRRGVAVSAIADDFGFAGASGFSHAYRRVKLRR